MITNFLKEYRKSNSITQEELAQKLCISRQAVISIEKAKYTPSLELAFKISNFFDTDINNLFKYKEGNKPLCNQ